MYYKSNKENRFGAGQDSEMVMRLTVGRGRCANVLGVGAATQEATAPGLGDMVASREASRMGHTEGN